MTEETQVIIKTDDNLETNAPVLTFPDVDQLTDCSILILNDQGDVGEITQCLHGDDDLFNDWCTDMLTYVFVKTGYYSEEETA